MFIIIGALVVFGSVAGGYLMEGGQPLVLNQPAEFLIIGGAALGSLLIGTPPSVIKRLLNQMKMLFGAGTSKNDYSDLLAMLYQLFKVAQQSGVMALEPHFEVPANSTIVSKYPKFLGRHHAVDFLADSIKVIIIGGIGAHDFEALMDQDLEVRHEEAAKPAATLNKVADALPGLGIVAAVLGVVITMGAIDGPPAEIGHKVGAALVGTFLGILASYGFFGPLAGRMEALGVAEMTFFRTISSIVLAFVNNVPPKVAIDQARRGVGSDMRPSREELEQLFKDVEASG